MKRAPLKQLGRRSDILITSTTSMSIFPKDKRKMSKIDMTRVKGPALTHYIDERNAFLLVERRDKSANFKCNSVGGSVGCFS